MEKKQVRVIEPETDEVLVINNIEELRRLFEELKRGSEAFHRKRAPS